MQRRSNIKHNIVAQAHTKMAMISPRKLGLMADLMRKLKSINKCIQQLLFHPSKKAAGIVLKALKSALANATEKKVYSDDLIVYVVAHKGKTLSSKPYFRGRGRVDRKQRYTSNLTVQLQRPERIVEGVLNGK